MDIRGAWAVRLLLVTGCFVLSFVGIGSPARATEARDFLERSDGCISDHGFNDVFHLASVGGTGWNLYVPNRDNSAAQADVRRIDRKIPRVWQTYSHFLSTAPGDAVHPIRVVVLNHPLDVISGGRLVGGRTVRSCDSGNNLYVFVPRGVSDQMIAHEFFHAFQDRRSPTSPFRDVPVWWSEGTAEWAANLLMEVSPYPSMVSLLWRLPQAPLELSTSWNPTDIPSTINGVSVLRSHPYDAIAPFLDYLARTFGELPSRFVTPRFGAFLDDTFNGYSRSARRDTSEGLAHFDRSIDAALRSRYRRTMNPRIPAGLGEAYAQFARSRMFGAKPEEIGFRGSGAPGSNDFNLFRSWFFRRVALADGDTVELEAPVGLTVDPVELMRPAARQVSLTIEGDLPPEGRFFMQIGDVQQSEGVGYGTAPVFDLSRELGSTLGSAPPETVDPLMGRTSHFCLTSANNAPFRWPNTEGLRVMLVNAANGSPGSSAVRIGIRATFSNEPCRLTAYTDPSDSRFRLKPDGSGVRCPVPEQKPPGAPDTWEEPPLPDPHVCDSIDAPLIESPINPPTFDDEWSQGRPLEPARIIDYGGIDCDENRRQRRLSAREGRPRTESERLADRECDRLTRGRS